MTKTVLSPRFISRCPRSHSGVACFHVWWQRMHSSFMRGKVSVDFSIAATRPPVIRVRQRTSMSFFRAFISALAGAVFAMGGTALFLVIEETLYPLGPGYAAQPDSFRQVRNMFRDGDTVVALSLGGAVAGVLLLFAYRWASNRFRRRRSDRGLCVGCGY